MLTKNAWGREAVAGDEDEGSGEVQSLAAKAMQRVSDEGEVRTG